MIIVKDFFFLKKKKKTKRSDKGSKRDCAERARMALSELERPGEYTK